MQTRVTRLLDLIIDRNYVLVAGQRIERPQRIAPSQWLETWERVAWWGTGASNDRYGTRPDERRRA